MQSFIALHFGTGEGEGGKQNIPSPSFSTSFIPDSPFSRSSGTFALWTALFPRKIASEEDRQLTRYATEEPVDEKVGTSNRMGSNLLRKSKWPLMVWALFGTSLVLGDG